MKKIIITLLILLSLKCFSQPATPQGFTFLNQRYDWFEGKFRTLHIPAGSGTQTLYGGWTGAGALYWDSVGKKLYVWDGAAWQTTGGGGSGTISNVKLINNTDSITGTGNIRTRAEGYNTIVDTTGSGYPGFPYADVWQDKVYYIWKASSTHAGVGTVMLGRSRDGNTSIDSTWSLNVPGIDNTPDSAGNFAFGIIKTGSHAGRILITWMNTLKTDSITHTAYSDDGMQTWTAGNDIVADINSRPFGRIRQVGGDTVVTHRYSVGASLDTSFLHYTVDGVTWAFYDTIGTVASFANSNGEADLLYLGNNKVIASTRCLNLNYPITWLSTDNGHTYTKIGGLNRLDFSTNSTPTFLEKYNNKIWALSNFRDGAGNNSVWWYSYGSEANVTVDSASWVARRAIYHPMNDDLGNATLGIENGYTVPFQMGGKLMVAGYDNSPLQTNATAKVRSLTIPIIANGDFCKVYTGNAHGNQSISNNTATLVTYLDVDMNDELMYNTDSNFVIFQRDGWYEYKAVATFDTSNAGTYRQMYAFVTAPAYSVAAFAQPQILSQTTIPGHQNNFDFNRMEISGVYFFRKNEQLKIFVKQDSGGSLNIINNTPNRMATLVVKRLIN